MLRLFTSHRLTVRQGVKGAAKCRSRATMSHSYPACAAENVLANKKGNAMLTRFLAALGALFCWAGLGIQFYILVTGPLGPVGGAWHFIAFFTVLMNILAAYLFTLAIFRPNMSTTHARLQSASAAYMILVGATYVLFLAPIWNPQGLSLVADRLLHHAAPVAAVVFWLVCVPKAGLNWSDPLRWSGIPLLYLIYALARASLEGFYPYFFIDVAQLGWPRVLLNAGAMLIAFVVLGLAMVALGRVLRPKSASSAADIAA